MKTKIHQALLAIAIITAPIFAGSNQMQVQSATKLPPHCRVIGDVKVGDIAAFGRRSEAEVIEELKQEAREMGGNYVLTDVKRVNHPKSGIYYWGWGTVGYCEK